MSDKIKTDSPEWARIKEWLIENYQPGQLITHEILRSLLKIKSVDFSDYSGPDEFLKAHQEVQFHYMGMVDTLREDLLTNDLLYMANVRGLGYHFLHPWQQQEYAFDLAKKQIRAALELGTNIMTFVRQDELTPEVKRRGSDLSVKLSGMRQMFNSVRRK
ncbi:hypothetical protein SNE25_20940 [Mucilaginibacter sabulilitoris]|uniref:Uncharacterized protein n=1 Tax=Mucilaginibacter sabulilitoris TaxID=1173583 RepID=A0ABZ0TF48_9SPHI|nr:hypothetical protein [Mucilaginibacter sabulilitoris]WPU91787.1 hypothetical protein SNE25_20940 [Mucilaginibacter sabulilitoris]